MLSSLPSFRRGLLPILLGFMVSGCAVPQAPTGGPPDQEPPSVIESDPVAQATNVSTQSITLTFSEHVERSSLQEALTITPPFEESPTLDWSGRSVTIHFPERLRDNTTYLITFRTSLQDRRGVQLDQPITIAFSTGPEINRHTLKGRIVRAASGAGVSTYDVFAYPVSPDSLIDPRMTTPAYRTQTDSRGHFTLEYLADTTFYLAGVEDQNRNYRPDPGESFAVPSRTPVKSRPPEASDSLFTLVITRLDTIPPELRQVQPQSVERTQLIFNEPIILRSLRPDWRLRSEATADTADIRTTYASPSNARRVVLETTPLDSLEYQLAVSGAVTDTSANMIRDTVVSFTAAPGLDGEASRVEEYLPPPSDQPYPDIVRPGLQLNRPIDLEKLERRASVIDSTGEVLDGRWQTIDGTEYRFFPERSLVLQDTVVITVAAELADADSVVRHPIGYYENSAYGSISGTLLPSDTTATVIAAADGRADRVSYSTQSDSAGRFHLARLPEGLYHVRGFLDENLNGRRDGGRLYPYAAGEPMFWEDSVRVRARWETDLDTLHTPQFRRIQ